MMKILQYTEEHKQFREQVRSFMKKEIAACSEQWEKERIMPKSAWKRMGKAGLLCTTISPEYGGQGKDFLHAVIIAEEICYTSQNGQGPVTHSDIVVPYITSFASEEIKKKYLPGCISGDVITAVAMTEPDVGSDIASIATTAVEKGDEVIINGSKIFITNGINTNLVILAARDPLIENPYKALSLYLVDGDSPGFQKGKHLDKMGMHSQDTAELFFSDCRIPKKNRLGQKGEGFKLLMENLQQERLLLTLWGLVVSELVLEITLSYYKNNSGSNKFSLKSQANQFSLVEMATDVKIGRTFFDKLIVEHMEGKNIIVETSMAKHWIATLVRRVCNGCLDLFGDSATAETCSVIRYWRDTRVLSIVGGTNEIMKSIVAKFMGL